jgi:hypothetical protein
LAAPGEPARTREDGNYSSTNTKRARPNINELPRTDLQWLAAPFPSQSPLVYNQQATLSSSPANGRRRPIVQGRQASRWAEAATF